MELGGRLLESALGGTEATDFQAFGYLSQSIQRALDVLFALSAPSGKAGLTLTELSSRLGLPKSTMVRLLANLEVRGLVEEGKDRRYRIGLAMFSIGTQALAGNELRRVARPLMEALSHRVGESCYLAITVQDEALYIERIESPQPVLNASPIGAHRPLHATAVGKVMLAALPADEVETIVARTGLAPRTDKTITDLAALRARLAEIRKAGYDLDFGEYELGLTCMAAPVRDADGRVIAAVGVSGPDWRLTTERAPQVAATLVETARSISAELGFRGLGHGVVGASTAVDVEKAQATPD